MAIELIEQQHTTRTYPRLMKSKVTGTVLLVLHDHTGGVVWLNGPSAGRTAVDIDWSAYDDYIGSVTLHNRD